MKPKITNLKPADVAMDQLKELRELRKLIERERGKPANSDLFTDSQLATLLGVEERTLRAWRKTRGLPFIKISSKMIRYRRADIDQWLEQNRTVI